MAAIMSLGKVGRYEIIGELGRGAMGVVYKAQDPTIGRTVALKTMRLDGHGIESAELVRRFQNEARAAGLLNHPNIVTIYDAGEHEGIFYIAMEYIEGTTLDQLLAQKQILDPDEVIRISRDICKGLDYAHAHGIVHRDVKPANIMITARGSVKIMDFGIAKAGGSMTSTGQVLGTPNYMSPEQVRGKSLDGRTDLFSYGVVLYEMLTGEKPFVGQNVTTIIYKIVNENPIAPRELDRTLHPGLNAIVVKALSKTPDERYQSGAELVRDLESYKMAGATLPAAARPPQNPSGPAPAHEKTVVIPMRVVAGSTVRAAAPAAETAKGPIPMRSPASAVPSSRKSGWTALIVTVLVLGAVAGSLAFYKTRVKVRQLEAEVQADDSRVAATQTAKPDPAPTPSPTPDASIAHDTTVKLVPAEKIAEEKSPFKPRATPPPAPKSELDLASQPDGAKVEIDGQSDPAWVTPFKISHLAGGSHNLVFSKDGYITQTRSLDYAAGKSASISVELAAGAKVPVNSNPGGAAIWVDSKDSGMVTPSLLTLETGEHQISVRRTGYRDALWEGNLAAGQNQAFSPVLLSVNQQAEKGPGENFLTRFLGTDAIPDGKGLVHIRTVPDGATIVVNGHVAAKKTNVKWPADPGVYSIDLQLPGYKSVHRNIQVKQGHIASLDEILEKQ
ncbi:MAG TPA: protein kinase [Terriglobales bacterium]